MKKIMSFYHINEINELEMNYELIHDTDKKFRQTKLDPLKS